MDIGKLMETQKTDSDGENIDIPKFSLYSSGENMRKKALLMMVLGCILIIGIELFVFNYSYFSQNSLEEITLDLSLVESEQIEYSDEKIITKAQSGWIDLCFSDLNVDCENVQIQMAGPERIIRCYVDIMDKGYGYTFQRANYVDLIPSSEKYNTGIANVFSHGKLKNLKISFESVSEDIVVSKIVINAKRKIEISVLRLVLMLLSLFVFIGIKVYLWNKVEYDWKNKFLKLGCFVPMVFLIGWMTIVQNIRWDENAWLLYEYPFIGINSIYDEQFDAFQNGQLALLADVDTRLEELDNPYDFSEREVKGVWTLWDHAYYNGKYYSYYGIAPIITLYYPFYWITGKVPGIVLCGYIMGVLSIIAVYSMTYQLLKHFFAKINYMFLLVACSTVVMSSQIFVNIIENQMYYLSYGSATAFSSLAIMLGIKACDEQRKKLRRIYLPLSAIATVLTVLSRPTALLFVVAVLAPLFLQLLVRAKTEMAAVLIDAASFLIPVLCGAVGICIFNVLRFDSPFEFGSNYQMTISDISQNEVHLQNLGESLYYYFFNLPYFTREFPWFNFSLVNNNFQNSTGNYLYVVSHNYGVFSIPITWTVFMLFIKNKMPGMMRIICVLSMGCAVLIAFLDLSVGGILSRYVGDIQIGVLLVSILVAAHFWQERIFDENKQPKRNYAITVISALMVLSICFGFLLLFNSEYGNMYGNAPELYLYFKNIIRV